MNDNRNSFENSELTLDVFIDLLKTFNTVNYNILLTMLKHYGINGFKAV